LEGVDIPTVHISLPERVYSELKRIASDMGIQLTDLIKMFIKMGLNGNIVSPQGNGQVTTPLISKLERDIAYLKGRIYVIDNVLRDLQLRIEEIERRLEEIESPDILLNMRKYGEGRLNKP